MLPTGFGPGGNPELLRGKTFPFEKVKDILANGKILDEDIGPSVPMPSSRIPPVARRGSLLRPTVYPKATSLAYSGDACDANSRLDTATKRRTVRRWLPARRDRTSRMVAP
jgi:hypothetical protein